MFFQRPARDCLLIAAAMLSPAARSDVGPEEASLFPSLRPFAWCAPEIASGHISTGRVKVTHPVHNFDAGLGVEAQDVGYVLAGVWTLTDLSQRYRDRRDVFWNEIDPVVTVGRHQPLAEGYRFDTSVGAQWNYMAGYKGSARRSYDEWQLREALITPFVTPWFSMRNFYWPVAKASFRVGLTRTFNLTDRLLLIPNVWTDGGGERWNEQRFGYRHASRIGRGLNSASARLLAAYEICEHVRVFVAVTGYCVVDDAIRAELRDNPSNEARHVYALVTCGLRMGW